MKLLALIVVPLAVMILGCDSSSPRVKPSSPPPPAGMITAIRENGAWKFRIRLSTSGYNASSSVKVTLNGADLPSSQLMIEPNTGASFNETYVNVLLSDDIVKTGILDLTESRRSNRGDEGSTLYTIDLADLTK